jgi:hypothetical protein
MSEPEMCYTIVETTKGYVYIVLLERLGKVIYDPRAVSPSAKGAETALRMALGKADFARLEYVTPGEMLSRMAERWPEQEAE